jgi:hypothetical protein
VRSAPASAHFEREVETMAFMVMSFEVENYDEWKEVFDSTQSAGRQWPRGM